MSAPESASMDRWLDSKWNSAALVRLRLLMHDRHSGSCETNVVQVGYFSAHLDGRGLVLLRIETDYVRPAVWHSKEHAKNRPFLSVGPHRELFDLEST
jgi:hypothetical protein